MRYNDNNSVFSYIMSQMVKYPTEQVSTLAVSYQDGTILLYYNEEFCDKTKKYMNAWLKHECMHVLFGHCTSRKPEDETTHALWNIAFDLAVNQFLLMDLPSDEQLAELLEDTSGQVKLCVPTRGKFEDYPLGLSSEKYYELLKQDPEIPEYMKDPKFFSHKFWEEFENLPEPVKDMIKESLSKAISESGGKLPGDMTEFMKKEIPELAIGPQKLHVLLDRINGFFARKATRRRTRSRVDRRYSEFPGKINERTFHSVVVLMDHSGSVDESKLSMFWAFLKYLNKHYNVVTVPFTVQAHLELAEKFAVMRFRHPSRRASGGTDVDRSIVEAMAKYKGDYVFVILSDFETGRMTEQPFQEGRTFAVCLKQDEGTMTSFREIPQNARYVIE